MFDSSIRDPGVWFRFRARLVLLGTLCLAISWLPGCDRSTPAVVDSNASETETGTVTIEFIVDGKPNQTQIVEDVAAGTTLETVMRGLDSPAMDLGGSGTTAFVNSIDGIETDASRGWTFTVDGEFAKVGIGSLELTPPTKIEWKFTTFEEAMAND